MTQFNTWPQELPADLWGTKDWTEKKWSAFFAYCRSDAALRTITADRDHDNFRTAFENYYALQRLTGAINDPSKSNAG